jgi:lysine 2,3-aminomutase
MKDQAEKAMWQRDLRESLRTAEDLADAGLIPREEVARYAPLLKKYQFLLPRYYAELIDRADRTCPIRLQAVPNLKELEEERDWTGDPLGDLSHKPVSRITHRYPNRALLHLTQNCSMYCRFCFRKTLLNELSPELFAGGLDPAVQYLSQHREIEEVIFSGGDPLFVSDESLRQVLQRLEFIPHLKRLRFHTRVPVTLPSRVTPELIGSISTRLPIVIVLHYNHPRELTEESVAACQLLASSGATLLNQSVLLRGVNDSADVLASLSEGLFSAGILPYYLHHPDAAQGTSYFFISKEDGKRIYDEVRGRLSGYLVPRYVWDDGSDRFKAFVD